MLPDRVSNPGPLTYESGALPIALHGPARLGGTNSFTHLSWLLCSRSHNDVHPKLSGTYPWPQYGVTSTCLGHSSEIFIL